MCNLTAVGQSVKIKRVIKLRFLSRMKSDAEYRKHIILYFIFGVITTLVSWGSFYLLRHFVPVIEENIANIISIVLAVITAYITNRRYVFKSVEKNILKEFLAFCSSRAVTMLLEALIFFVFATVLDFPEMVVKIGESVIIMILNYFFSKFFVFKKIIF